LNHYFSTHPQNDLPKLKPIVHSFKCGNAVLQVKNAVHDGDDLVAVDEIEHGFEILVGSHCCAEDGNLLPKNDLRAEVLYFSQAAAINRDPAAGIYNFQKIGKACSASAVHDHIKTSGLFFECFRPLRRFIIGSAFCTHFNCPVDLVLRSGSDINLSSGSQSK